MTQTPDNIPADNKAVAAVLRLYSDLLELSGGDKYRFLAYRKAADAVRVWPERVADLSAENRLTVIPGVGDKMAGVIEQVLRTGTFDALEELEDRYPGTLAQIMRVPGVGRKRAVQLHERLGIANLEELEEALADGRIERAGGFGAKTAQKMAESVEAYRRHSERTPLADLIGLAQSFEDAVRGLPHALEASLAGSIRRNSDTVGNIDVVVSTTSVREFTEEVSGLTLVDRVESSDGDSVEIVLYDGTRAAVRLTGPASYGAALRYFTGDREHNVAFASLAAERGFEVTAEGLMHHRRALTVEDEAAIFSAIGLPFLPPETREGPESLSEESLRRIPNLVSIDDVRGDLQSHSTFTDGRGSLEENRAVAAELGYEYFAATDHAYDLRMVGGLDIEALERQWTEIDALNESRGELPLILKGIELNIGETGGLDYDDEVLSRFDIVLASLHSGWDQESAIVTGRMLAAIEHPLVDVIAHPTGRVLGRRDPLRLDMEAVLWAAAETGTVMEINSYPDRLDLSAERIRLAHRFGVRFSLGTDAHAAGHFKYMPFGVMQARRGLITPDELINSLPWEAARTRLKRFKVLG